MYPIQMTIYEAHWQEPKRQIEKFAAPRLSLLYDSKLRSLYFGIFKYNIW